jgi:hypothetical protein
MRLLVIRELLQDFPEHMCNGKKAHISPFLWLVQASEEQADTGRWAGVFSKGFIGILGLTML